MLHKSTWEVGSFHQVKQKESLAFSTSSKKNKMLHTQLGKLVLSTKSNKENHWHAQQVPGKKLKCVGEEHFFASQYIVNMYV
jgi:hypothetical protein